MKNESRYHYLCTPVPWNLGSLYHTKGGNKNFLSPNVLDITVAVVIADQVEMFLSSKEKRFHFEKSRWAEWIYGT